MRNRLLLTALIALSIVSCKNSSQNNKAEQQNEMEVSFVESKNKNLLALTSTMEENFPSYNPNFPPPSGFEAFELSQNYPTEYAKENYPWLEIDFKANPNEYIHAVLKYSLEGNLEVNFKGQDNTIRKWYHAPWLHDDGRPNGNGREYIHGLTRERGTPKFEIHDNQDVELENWAVGMYNAPGGYTLGKVWNTEDGKPNPKNAEFPDGTVAFKLLFTDGTTDKVPFLDGTLEWQANIYPCSPRRCGATVRENRTVRLLQIDVAVKDSRASNIGWVFGTFMYDASAEGETVWDKMIPVGLSWGDDPTVQSDLNKDGAFLNNELKQTYLNADLIKDETRQYTDEAYVKYHGLGGRLNGPVDNPISSCISCHGQAGVNGNGRVLPMANFRLTRQDFPINEFNKYFSNVKGGAYSRTFDGNEYITTDYSLQVSAGIRNYYQNELFKVSIAENASTNNKTLETFSLEEINALKNYVEQLPEVSRGEE